MRHSQTRVHGEYNVSSLCEAVKCLLTFATLTFIFLYVSPKRMYLKGGVYWLCVKR